MDPKKLAEEFLSGKALNETLKEHVEANKRMLKKKETGIVPKMIVSGYNFEDQEKQNIMVAIMDLPDDEEKHRMIEGVGMKMATEMPRFFPFMVFFISEAWFRGQVDKNEKIKMPIRDNPTKTEGMIVSGMTMDKKTNMYMCPIARAKDNTIMLKESEERYSYYSDSDRESVTSNVLMSFFIGFSRVKVKK